MCTCVEPDYLQRPSAASILTGAATHVSSETRSKRSALKQSNRCQLTSDGSNFKSCSANFERRRSAPSLFLSVILLPALVAATMSPLIASAWIMPGEWAGCRQVERPSNSPPPRLWLCHLPDMGCLNGTPRMLLRMRTRERFKNV